jgi:hypothetical protein
MRSSALQQMLWQVDLPLGGLDVFHGVRDRYTGTRLADVENHFEGCLSSELYDLMERIRRNEFVMQTVCSFGTVAEGYRWATVDTLLENPGRSMGHGRLRVDCVTDSFQFVAVETSSWLKMQDTSALCTTQDLLLGCRFVRPCVDRMAILETKWTLACPSVTSVEIYSPSKTTLIWSSWPVQIGSRTKMSLFLEDPS